MVKYIIILSSHDRVGHDVFLIRCCGYYLDPSVKEKYSLWKRETTKKKKTKKVKKNTSRIYLFLFFDFYFCIDVCLFFCFLATDTSCKCELYRICWSTRKTIDHLCVQIYIYIHTRTKRSFNLIKTCFYFWPTRSEYFRKREPAGVHGINLSI